ILAQRAGGKHQDRHQLVDLPDRLASLIAAHPRHHHVENHDVDRLRFVLEMRERGRSIAGQNDVVALLLEIELQSLRERILIFDDQYSHNSALPGRLTSKMLPFPLSRFWTVTFPFNM